MHGTQEADDDGTIANLGAGRGGKGGGASVCVCVCVWWSGHNYKGEGGGHGHTYVAAAHLGEIKRGGVFGGWRAGPRV